MGQLKYLVTGVGAVGEVYSLDKLVVVFRLRSLSAEHQGGQRLLAVLGRLAYLEVEHWNSFKVGTYRSQFSIKCADGESFYLGVGLNGGGKPDNTARIEFNPNKVGGCWQLVAVYNLCFDLSGGRLEIRQYDLAVDYPVRRQDVELVKDARLYEERRRSAEDRTQYLGQRNKPGRCKLYNKQLEQGLREPLTRLEMTIPFEDCQPDRAREYMPQVRCTGGGQQTHMELPELNETDRFIVGTLLQQPERLGELSRRKREKLAPWLELLGPGWEFDERAYRPVLDALLGYLGKLRDEPPEPGSGEVCGAFLQRRWSAAEPGIYARQASRNGRAKNLEKQGKFADVGEEREVTENDESGFEL